MHLEATGADSSPLANTGTLRGSIPAAGTIGSGQSFSGVDWIELQESQPLLRNTGGATLSAWVVLDPRSLGATRGVIEIAVGSSGSRTTISRAALEVDFNGRAACAVRRDDADTVANRAFALALPPADFVHLALRVRYSDGMVDMFANGVPSGVLATTPEVVSGVTSDTDSRNAAIGSNDMGTAAFFVGTLDEVRIENVARSDAWIELSYLSQQTGSSVVQFGPLERR